MNVFIHKFRREHLKYILCRFVIFPFIEEHHNLLLITGDRLKYWFCEGIHKPSLYHMQQHLQQGRIGDAY